MRAVRGSRGTELRCGQHLRRGGRRLRASRITRYVATLGSPASNLLQSAPAIGIDGVDNHGANLSSSSIGGESLGSRLLALAAVVLRIQSRLPMSELRDVDGGPEYYSRFSNSLPLIRITSRLAFGLKVSFRKRCRS